MVIGEVLTPIAARQKQMLSGPALKILIDSMTKVGLPTTPDKVHLTTAIACAYPKKKGANPFPSEVLSNCRTRLLEDILCVKPKMILVLGKTALQSIKNDMGVKIKDEYGRLQEFSYKGFTTQMVPVMHPGLIVRAPNDYKPFLTQLQIAAKAYQGVEGYVPGVPRWQILNTEELCDQAVQKLTMLAKTDNPLWLGADMETTALDYRVAEYLVLGFAFEKNKVFIVPREMRHRVKDFFAIPNTKWVWQNGKYDAKVLWRRNLGLIPHDDDTQNMHYILDETTEHNLGYLTKTFINVPAYKYKMNQEFKAVTLETYESYFDALCERVAFDADYTRQLKFVFDEMLDAKGNESLRTVYDSLIRPATVFLEEVERNGMLVDKQFLEEMDIKYQQLIAEILAKVQRIAAQYWDPELYKEQTGAKTAPELFSPGSPQQMAWMVFDRLRLKPRRKKGRSTAKEILESIEDDIPLIAAVQEYRAVKKEHSTYVLGLLKWRDSDGRVRSNFNLHVTATGRLSSKEPNVQNIPAAKGVGNIRRAFIPPKGKILVEIDYSGAELRWLAFLSKCPVLSAVFTEGRNLHKETATALFGKDFTPAQKMRAKAVNFGIPYGREAQSFKEEFNIPIEEAQKMIDDWLNNYHGARDYLNWCADQVVEGKYLQSPWGNRRRFGLVTKESLHALQNEAKNFPIQGSSSHLLLWCAVQLSPILKEKWDTNIIDLIHDSMLLEVPDDLDTITAVSRYVSDLMVRAPKELFDCNIPFKTDTDIGYDWAHVTAFDHNKKCMVVENEHHEEYDVPFDVWAEENRHPEIYQQQWYTELAK